MTSIKKAVVLMAVLLITVIVFSACVRGPFRLHIIANSDSATDQQVKLDVRDAVLKVTKDSIKQCQSALDAKEYISNNLGIILETANETLVENDLSYRAMATVGIYHFPERSYQDVCYPEGEYQALRIILGDGKGENWWCVMFPPLCLSEIDQEVKDIEYTSFFAELFKLIFGE
ncbi:MAG: stage II sporulation protein R [Christensenellales bacterium]|jgi:stage II sporulation protein R